MAAWDAWLGGTWGAWDAWVTSACSGDDFISACVRLRRLHDPYMTPACVVPGSLAHSPPTSPLILPVDGGELVEEYDAKTGELMGETCAICVISVAMPEPGVN